MEHHLTHKIAVVTGSSAGIGLATSKLLYQHGATVILNGRSKDKLLKIQKEMESENSPGSIQVVEADLGSAEGVQKFIKEVPHCDILVNNVGIYSIKPFEEITDEEWQRMWEINVMSGVRLTRHYFKGMRKNNWGRIVFVSSESGVQIPPEMIHYGVTKTAQIGLARGIAELTAKTEITVNSILVGPTYTEGVEQFVKEMAEQKGTSIQKSKDDFFIDARPSSIIKRFITPEEIGNVITFICSPEASAINGAAVRAEGGIIRSI